MKAFLQSEGSESIHVKTKHVVVVVVGHRGRSQSHSTHLWRSLWCFPCWAAGTCCSLPGGRPPCPRCIPAASAGEGEWCEASNSRDEASTGDPPGEGTRKTLPREAMEMKSLKTMVVEMSKRSSRSRSEEEKEAG